MQNQISYNYTNEPTNFGHVYLNAYVAYFGIEYNHSYKLSFILDNKFPINHIHKMLDEHSFIIGFDEKLSSTVRGLDSAAYEDDEEEGFDAVDAEEDYLDYVFLFNKSRKIGVCLNYGNNGAHILQICVTYRDEADKEDACTLVEQLRDKLIQYKKPIGSKRKVNFICQSSSGLYLQELTLKNKTSFDITNHYNDDFQPISDHIINSLGKESTKGIILLHGKHGTGKTSYLRYLINSLEKNIIYVSPDMSARVSEPSFLSFLLRYKNSILIIEDAENVIKTREAGENQAVSNLLNITDGILGDGLNFQIICTFNTNFDQIDPALKRKGRMIAQYEFKDLTEDKTSNLVHKLYGDTEVPLAKEMSLAEIFNMRENNFDKIEQKSSFGFM